MDHPLVKVVVTTLMIKVVQGLVDLGDVYSLEVTAPRYKEYIYLGSGPVQCVHLSLALEDQMTVSWLNPTPFKAGIFKPQCSYGSSQNNLSITVFGNSYTYPDGMFEMTLNKALLKLSPLPTDTIYYRCGDNNFGFSPIYNFTLQSKQPDQSKHRLLLKSHKSSGFLYEEDSHIDPSQPIIAITGDHSVKRGLDTANSIADHVKNDNVQLLVHVGDISYADKYGHNNSYVWVSYMNLLQQITAYVPYMTTPGNHESQYNFSAYLNWLAHSLPTTENGSDFWYSFDYMGVHFVAFSTEHDFSPNSIQHKWMEQDLIKANANRENSPWIIVFGHRPLYCTSVICAERCLKEAPVYRSHLEDLLYDQHVDVVFHGHNHQYERSYPVYKEKTVQKDYKTPKAPIYIVNGAAGSLEPLDPSFRKGVDWKAFDYPTFDTGYLLMQPTKTQLRFQYINSNKKKLIDQFIITKL